MKMEETGESNEDNVQPLKDLFHFSHFSRFYRLYVPAALLIGAACGLFMVGFQLLIDSYTYAFSILPVYVAPIAGGALSGVFILLGRKEIQGSGISKAIEMTHKPSSLRPGTTLTKLVTTSVSIGSGNPVGREGPAVLMGAGIGSSIGRKLGFHDESHLRVFLMMGSAAATAGIYKAPLGGALFATEAPYRRDARLGYFVPTVLAALTSFSIFSGLYPILARNGSGFLFTFQATFTFDVATIPMLVIFGIVAGLISIFFAVTLMSMRNFFATRIRDALDPVFGSLLACVVILFVSLFVLDSNLIITGLGYDVINYLAANPQPLIILAVLLFGKLFASSFVVAGKVSGGVLASSLFVGAMLGSIFGEIFYPANVPAFMVLGMGAVLAATTNTPVATTIMMLEMSHSFDLVIPLAICISLSYLVSGGTSLYEGQKMSRDDEERGYYTPINILPDYKLEYEETDDLVSTGFDNVKNQEYAESEGNLEDSA